MDVNGVGVHLGGTQRTIQMYPCCFCSSRAVSKNNNFKGSIYMVFDYAEYDLTGLMETQKNRFTEPQVRCCVW